MLNVIGTPVGFTLAAAVTVTLPVLFKILPNKASVSSFNKDVTKEAENLFDEIFDKCK